MLLILNCMIKDNLALSLNRAFLRPVEKTGLKYSIIPWPEFAELTNLSLYSHLIISGSEASAVDQNPWEPGLGEITRCFIDSKRAVLGICYGHQFLAKMIAGKHCVRKSKSPEFGYASIQVSQNALFKNIVNTVFMVSHYDEVTSLPPGFKITASTPGCAVHGFQLRDLPVWGVQFHPEYKEQEAEEIFTEFSKSDPRIKEYFINDLESDKQLDQNEIVIRNFCSHEV